MSFSDDFWTAAQQLYRDAIAPGIFPDPVTSGEKRTQENAERAKRTVPLKRHGQLREVGLLALYLASTLVLDGGLSL